MSRLIAGVAGNPVAHSLSPLIHGEWIAATGIDGSYERFLVSLDGFAAFVASRRGTDLRGVNITIPFKEQALALADDADATALAAGAANVLLFSTDGRVTARNTDGIGLLAAFADQAPAFSPKAGPIAVIGAGGAAKGAVAALVAAGAPQVRIVNRTLARAEAIAAAFPGRARAFSWEEAEAALVGVGAVINATSRGLNGVDDLDLPLEAAPLTAVAMDMVYKPLRTGFLKIAKAQGRTVVDGLSMLIGQARPSFEAFYGRPAPNGSKVRDICLKAFGEAP